MNDETNFNAQEASSKMKLIGQYEEDLAMAHIVRSGLERFHAPASRKKAELRRCNTDLRRSEHPKSPPETAEEEIQRLRKELAASLAAQKGLEIILSGLKEEKKYIKEELARNGRALQDMEEHLSDVETQNEMLLAKVKFCVAEHKDKWSWFGGGEHGEKSLLDRNKALSEKLLRVLDGYRNMKRKVLDMKEDKAETLRRMGDTVCRISKVLSHMRELSQGSGRKKGCTLAEDCDLVGDISSIEEMLSSLRVDIWPADDGRGRNAEEFLTKPSVVA